MDRRLEGIWDAGLARQVEAAVRASGKPGAAALFENLRTALDGYSRNWTGMARESCEATFVLGTQPEPVHALREACLERRREELGALTQVLAQAGSDAEEYALEAVSGLNPLSDCADVKTLSTPLALPDKPGALAELSRLHQLLARSKALESAGRFAEGLEVATEAVTHARALMHAPALAEALEQQGACSMRMVRGADAERILREAWEVAEQGRHDQVRARVAAYLTHTLSQLEGRPEEALLWGDLGQAALTRLGPVPQLRVLLRLNIGTALLALRRYEEARDSHLRVLALADKTLGPEDHFRPVLLNALGQAYSALNEYARARALTEEAIAVGEKLWGPNHPDIVIWRCNVAEIALHQGDDAAAYKYVSRALPQLESALGAESMATGYALGIKGYALVNLARHREAEPYLVRALTILKNHQLPENQEFQLLFHGAMAKLYLETGRPKEAIALIDPHLQRGDADGTGLANLRLLMAKALVLSGGDARRAHRLAEEARSGFAERHSPSGVASVDRWLAVQQW